MRNAPGVSCTAVASPIRNPRGHHGLLATQSARHKATSRMSTCPNRTWSRIGIKYVQATMRKAKSHGAYRAHPSRCADSTPLKEYATTTASDTKTPAVHTHWAVSQDIL